MVIETSLSISNKTRLKFQLAKNKYEIKKNTMITIDDFMQLIIEKYEHVEL